MSPADRSSLRRSLFDFASDKRIRHTTYSAPVWCVPIFEGGLAVCSRSPGQTNGTPGRGQRLGPHRQQAKCPPRNALAKPTYHACSEPDFARI